MRSILFYGCETWPVRIADERMLEVFDAESSVLAAFQLVQSGWGQPGLPGWGSVVENTDMKVPIDLEELIFPPAPPFGGK